MLKDAFEEAMKQRIAEGATAQETEEVRKTYAVSERRGILQRDLPATLASWE
jgi:hypothetical protein